MLFFLVFPSINDMQPLIEKPYASVMSINRYGTFQQFFIELYEVSSVYSCVMFKNILCNSTQPPAKSTPSLKVIAIL